MEPAEPTQRPYGDGRVSRARKTIAACAQAMPGAFTVDDLTRAVRAADPTGATATVYRAVAAMEASDFLERVGEREGSALYAHCAQHQHHHHIVCDVCGRTAPARCPVDPEILEGAATDGFIITRHSVTLYGLCPECARKAAV